MNSALSGDAEVHNDCLICCEGKPSAHPSFTFFCFTYKQGHLSTALEVRNERGIMLSKNISDYLFINYSFLHIIILFFTIAPNQSFADNYYLICYFKDNLTHDENWYWARKPVPYGDQKLVQSFQKLRNARPDKDEYVHLQGRLVSHVMPTITKFYEERFSYDELKNICALQLETQANSYTDNFFDNPYYGNKGRYTFEGKIAAGTSGFWFDYPIDFSCVREKIHDFGASEMMKILFPKNSSESILLEKFLSSSCEQIIPSFANLRVRLIGEMDLLIRDEKRVVDAIARLRSLDQRFLFILSFLSPSEAKTDSLLKNPKPHEIEKLKNAQFAITVAKKFFIETLMHVDNLSKDFEEKYQEIIALYFLNHDQHIELKKKLFYDLRAIMFDIINFEDAEHGLHEVGKKYIANFSPQRDLPSTFKEGTISIFMAFAKMYLELLGDQSVLPNMINKEPMTKSLPKAKPRKDPFRNLINHATAAGTDPIQPLPVSQPRDHFIDTTVKGQTAPHLPKVIRTNGAQKIVHKSFPPLEAQPIFFNIKQKYLNILKDLVRGKAIKVNEYMKLYAHIIKKNKARFESASILDGGTISFLFKFVDQAPVAYSVHRPHGKSKGNEEIPPPYKMEYYKIFELMGATPDKVKAID